MAHQLVLLLHIAAAMLLAGSTAASRMAGRGVRVAPDLATLRGALDIVAHTTRSNPVLAVVVLVSGALLGRAGWWFAPWFWVAVATWTANLILAVRFVGPGHQALGTAARCAGDGPVPAPVNALRHARAPALALDVMIALDVATLVLMVTKPPAAGALLWPALGIALPWALRLAGEQRRAQATAAAAGR